MKFGIFMEIAVPQPWDQDSEVNAFTATLTEAQAAETAGFDSAWVVEHHFLREYSHSSAPDVFLAALAMRTNRIRLGHGITVCVPEINHPIRMAERAAVLDILSGGRLEFGTGRSGTWTELGGFNADPDETKRTWDEFVRMFPRMWTEDTFAYESDRFSVPPRSILPKPLQKPHPPMWVAVTSERTELDAAERGLGCLWLSLPDFAQQEARIKEYRRRIQSCDPVSSVVNDQALGQSFLYCHEDNALAIQRGTAIQRAFGMRNSQLAFAREVFPTPAYQLRGNLIVPTKAIEPDDPGAGVKVPEGIVAGDPDRIVEQLRRWEATGIDGVNFVIDPGAGTVEVDDVIQSLKLFGSEVIPKFR